MAATCGTRLRAKVGEVKIFGWQAIGVCAAAAMGSRKDRDTASALTEERQEEVMQMDLSLVRPRMADVKPCANRALPKNRANKYARKFPFWKGLFINTM